MKHLRDRRNEYVHHAQEHQNPELLIMQLREYVQVLLRWLIANPHRFGSAEEFAEFLDSPDNSRKIEQKIRILRAARKTVEKP